MDHDQESAADAQELAADANFEPMPPESEEVSLGDDAGDDSDAPIRLDELEPEEPAASVESAADPGSGPVRAENVTLQGGAQSIEASTVSITQGGAGRVTADELSIQQGGVGFARTENLTVSSESSVFAVVADSATVEPGASVFMLITRSLSGEVRPVLDWRAALALGGGFALVLSILRRLR